MDEGEERFIGWLQRNHVVLSPSVAIGHTLEDGQERGVVALEAVAEDDVLFRVPREAMLMVGHSRLVTLLGGQEVMERELGRGWTPLIVTMMWEDLDQGSFWRPYLDILPTTFATPMFWPAVDLVKLKGCDIESRIGKDEAELNFHQRVLPLLKLRPDIFTNPQEYTLERYHRMGSLIMSYSFNLSGAPSEGHADTHDDSEDDQDEEEDLDSLAEEDGTKIAMIPFADLLNSKTGFCNAKLYNGPDGSFVMRAAKAITKGEQIYNTYGPLPNGELVRRYGYFDSPNENDTVGLSMELILSVVGDEEARQDKLSWLEEYDLLEEEYLLPPESDSATYFSSSLILTIKVLLAATTKKSKLKKLSDEMTPQVAETLCAVLQERLSRYYLPPDESHTITSPFSTMASVVRDGEKRILSHALEELSAVQVPRKRPHDD